MGEVVACFAVSRLALAGRRCDLSEKPSIDATSLALGSHDSCGAREKWLEKRLHDFRTISQND